MKIRLRRLKVIWQLVNSSQKTIDFHHTGDRTIQKGDRIFIFLSTIAIAVVLGTLSNTYAEVFFAWLIYLCKF